MQFFLYPRCFEHTWYDDEGNLIKKTNKSDDTVWWYSYDHINRMIGATHREADDSVITDVRFIYDIMGRRIIKKVDDDGDGSWDDGTKTVYDGDNAYADFDLSNNLEYRYLPPPVIGPSLNPRLHQN